MSLPEQPSLTPSPAVVFNEFVRTAIPKKSRKELQAEKRAKKRKTAAVTQEKGIVGTDLLFYSSGAWKKLPLFYKDVFKLVQAYFYDGRFQRDCMVNGFITKPLSKKKLKKCYHVFIAFLTSGELHDGMIGRVTKAGVDTASHDALMLEHHRRWGYYICDTTWYEIINLLKEAGLFDVDTVQIPYEYQEETRWRSVAAYKYLTQKARAICGAFIHAISSEMKQARERSEKKGYTFDWIPCMTQRLRKELKLKARRFDEQQLGLGIIPPHPRPS